MDHCLCGENLYHRILRHFEIFETITYGDISSRVLIKNSFNAMTYHSSKYFEIARKLKHQKMHYHTLIFQCQHTTNSR